MDVKTQESAGWANEAAKVAHDTVDNLREYAAKLEDNVGKKATVSAGRIGTGLEGRAKAVGEFIEANPIQAAVMAFGMGIWASRVFKSMESRQGQAGSAGKLRKAAQS